MVLTCGAGVKDASAIVHPGSMTQTPPTSLRWRAYRLVRPIVRPVAWRLRSFFVGSLQDEVRELAAQMEALRTELRERSEREAAALEPQIAAVLEQALLTLALDRERHRSPQAGEPLP